MSLYVCNRATSIDAKLISASSAEGAALKFAELNPEDGRFIQVRVVSSERRQDFMPSFKRTVSVQAVSGSGTATVGPMPDPGDVADKADCG